MLGGGSEGGWQLPGLTSVVPGGQSCPGVIALTTATGRVTIMMPHPERVFRSACMSWSPADWPEDSPWMQMFYNARLWVG